MYCQKCGNKLEDGDLFCQNCGTRVEANSATSSEGENLNPQIDIPRMSQVSSNVDSRSQSISGAKDTYKGRISRMEYIILLLIFYLPFIPELYSRVSELFTKDTHAGSAYSWFPRHDFPLDDDSAFIFMVVYSLIYVLAIFRFWLLLDKQKLRWWEFLTIIPPLLYLFYTNKVVSRYDTY